VYHPRRCSPAQVRAAHVLDGVPRARRSLLQDGYVGWFDHDGLVDKFVGDELVTMFLPLLSGEQHAARASLDSAERTAIELKGKEHEIEVIRLTVAPTGISPAAPVV
jgi:hypothetical protein